MSLISGSIISLLKSGLNLSFDFPGRLYSRLLDTQHLYGICTGLIPYRLRLDTLSEYPEP